MFSTTGQLLKVHLGMAPGVAFNHTLCGHVAADRLMQQQTGRQDCQGIPKLVKDFLNGEML